MEGVEGRRRHLDCFSGKTHIDVEEKGDEFDKGYLFGIR